MSTEDNKAVVRDYFATLDREQSMAAGLDRVAAADYLGYFPAMPPLDREAMAAYANAFFTACPGLQHRLQTVMAEGDEVTVRLQINAKNTRSFVTPNGEIPATGKDLTLDVMNYFRFQNGKVSEHRAYFDMLGFLQALGAIPA